MAVDYKIEKEANELQKKYDLTSYEALSLALQARQIEVIEKYTNPKL